VIGVGDRYQVAWDMPLRRFAGQHVRIGRRQAASGV
jgi:hypothetical protein